MLPTMSARFYASIGLVMAFGAGLAEPAPVDRCDLATVGMQVHAADIEVRARLASTQIENLNEIKKLSNKATRPGISVGAQLSTEDNVLFDQARQRLITSQMRGVIESRRARDADVILGMVEVADKNYRYQSEVPEGHSDFLYQESLNLLRGAEAISPRNPDIRDPVDRSCSFDLALYQVEREGIDRILQTDLSSVTELLHGFQAKYGMTKIDRARLSDSDKARYDDVMQRLVRPYERVVRFVGDLENIRILAKASELIYESDKADLDLAAGDVSKVGKSIDEYVQKTQDLLMLTALTLLRKKIDAERPSEAMVQLKRQVEVVDEACRKFPALDAKCPGR